MSKVKLVGHEKILIIRPDRIGDLVLTLPVAAMLKKFYPKLTIHYLVSGYNASVIKYARHIDDYMLISDSNGGRVGSAKLVELLESQSYNLAIFSKPGWLTSFACFLAGIPLRLGTSRRSYSFFFNERIEMSRRHSNMHEVDLNLMMLRAFGINSEPGTIHPELARIPGKLSTVPELNNINEYVIIHPGSMGSAPNWSFERYADLIGLLSEKMQVVVTGQSNKSFELPDRAINLINKTDFDQLIEMISGAKLFISGSTGPMHIAAAFGTPVLGLFPNHPVMGPQRWAPRGKCVSYITPAKQNGHICRIKDNGSCDCMEGISMGDVYDKAFKMMTAGKRRS
ncbi:MAG: glycosyltransferase family 9 protein [candidate division Zixibacteria bacterium]|nr:glycosyltransferase family 9 protein [candidate division Zixibacteria bacterium]